MSSLSDSLKLKAAGQKAPAVTGTQLHTPDTPLDEGKSGGIAKSKQVKNAGSTSPTAGDSGLSSKFTKSIGGGSQSDKTVGYF